MPRASENARLKFRAAPVWASLRAQRIRGSRSAHLWQISFVPSVRGVVGEDELPVLVRLLDDRLDRGLEVRLSVEDGEPDRDERDDFGALGAVGWLDDHWTIERTSAPEPALRAMDSISAW